MDKSPFSPSLPPSFELIFYFSLDEKGFDYLLRKKPSF